MKKIGYIFLGLLLFVGLAGCSFQTEKYSYDQIVDQSNNAMGKLNSALENNKDITLVLYRTGCQACEDSKDTIVPYVQTLRQERTNVVVIDLTKLSDYQINYLKQLVPDVLVFNNKLASPTVANLRVDSNRKRFKAIQYSNDGNLVHIRKVLARARG